MRSNKRYLIFGTRDRHGCGSLEDHPTQILLQSPRDTALVWPLLFVADSSNGRVLCLDMRTNKCNVAFKGRFPTAIAADVQNLFVYDLDENKVFHVHLKTWEVKHVLGTGTRAFSPEGALPLATNLNRISSMAIGHNGELVYACAEERRVMAFEMPQDNSVLSAGPLLASTVKLFDHQVGDEHNALVPTAGAK